MIDINDKVIVTNRRLKHTVCVGMKGIVIGIDDSIYTDEEVRNKKGFRKIKVKATNWGHMMKGSTGKDKKVFAWRPDNTATFFVDELAVYK